MPTKRSRKPGAMTSAIPRPCARARSAAPGRPASLRGPDDVAAGLAVLLELDEALLFRVLEEIREGLVAIVGLVESRVAPLERLLDHRAPDLLVRAALGDQGFQRAEHHVEGLLLLLLRRRRA